MLVRRGPYAYRNFVTCLTETEQHQVNRHLEETRSSLDLPPMLMQDECATVMRDASLVFPYNQPPLNNAEYRYTFFIFLIFSFLKNNSILEGKC